MKIAAIGFGKNESNVLSSFFRSKSDTMRDIFTPDNKHISECEGYNRQEMKDYALLCFDDAIEAWGYSTDVLVINLHMLKSESLDAKGHHAGLLSVEIAQEMSKEYPRMSIVFINNCLHCHWLMEKDHNHFEDFDQHKNWRILFRPRISGEIVDENCFCQECLYKDLYGCNIEYKDKSCKIATCFFTQFENFVKENMRQKA